MSLFVRGTSQVLVARLRGKKWQVCVKCHRQLIEENITDFCCKIYLLHQYYVKRCFHTFWWKLFFLFNKLIFDLSYFKCGCTFIWKPKKPFRIYAFLKNIFMFLNLNFHSQALQATQRIRAKAQRNIVFYNPSKILKSYFDMDDLDGFSYELRL